MPLQNRARPGNADGGTVTAGTRDELLNIESFGSLIEAQIVVEA